MTLMPVYSQITDFGCAKFQIGNMSTVTRRTCQWCAPEVNDNTSYHRILSITNYSYLMHQNIPWSRIFMLTEFYCGN